MKLVIHVGFQKTGTTTLQNCVFHLHPGMVNLGKPGFHDDRSWREALGHLISAKEGEYRAESSRRAIYSVLDKVNRGSGVPILSHEGLTNFYQNPSELIARRLREMFGEVRILFTIREQIAFIQSFFLHHASYGLFRGTARPFDRWLAADRDLGGRSAINHADFFGIIDEYVRLFGRSNVHVMPFELFLRDRSAFAAQLADTLGVARAETESLVMTATNQKERTSTRTYRFAVLNGMLVPAPIRWICKIVLPGALKRSVEDWMHQGERARLDYPPGMVDSLRQRYRAGNQRLAGEFGLPLAEYGYAT